MKISNLKIILLLVLGAFTLTLPNTVRAEDKLSKEMQDWLDTNLRLGTVKEGNNAELLNKIDELDKKYKEYKDQYYGLKIYTNNQLGKKVTTGRGYGIVSMDVDSFNLILDMPKEVDGGDSNGGT